nr:hypothetical protein CFP56_67651 [Quercus suber]
MLQRLMLRILKDSKLENTSPGYSVEVSEVWKALWLHRRFLSLCWMKQFATNLHDVSCHSELKISTSNSFNSFIDKELRLLNSCSIVPDNDFEDFPVQATYSATYILWLTKQILEFWSEFQEKLTIGNLKTMLSKVCLERTPEEPKHTPPEEPKHILTGDDQNHPSTHGPAVACKPPRSPPPNHPSSQDRTDHRRPPLI